MTKGGLTNCCLYLMYVFTFLFWLCGCAVLGVGLYLRFNSDVREIFGGMATYYGNSESQMDVNAIGTQFYLYYCYALMCLGGIIMFIGFIGCCGTIYESPCILCFFSILLLLLMVIEIGGGGYGYYEVEMKGSDSSVDQSNDYKSDQNRLNMWVARDMNNLVSNYETHKSAVDSIQQCLECCGATKFSDFGEKIPLSCTDAYNRDEVELSPDTHQAVYYEAGCTEKLTKFLREHVLAGLVVVFCVGVFQLFGIICAMCLCCGIRRYDDYSNV
jgi:CD9 antigen